MSDSDSLMETVVTQNGEGTSRVPGHRDVPAALGKVIELRRRLDDDKRDHAAKMHRLAAPVAALVLDAYGKDEAAAEFLKQPKQNISDKRTGLRGLVLWELVALLAAEREAFAAFAALFCALHEMEPPQPKKKITRAELAEMALEMMATGPLAMLLAGEAQRRRGTTEEEFNTALQAAK